MQRRPLFLFSICIALPVWLLGCGRGDEAPDYVARIGDQYLSREEVTTALQSMPSGMDTTEARQQIIEQWVTNTLLYQEAERRGLRSEPEIQQLLEENESSVMVSALVARLYEEVPAEPTPAELLAYYERYREQLRLREPYVRVRYLATANADSARAVQQFMQRLSPASADSVWLTIATRYAADPAASRELAGSYFPESQLLALTPEIQEAVTSLQNGQVSPVISSGDLHHVVQLVERAPAGSIPQMDWVLEDLTQRLSISARKQIFARQVERLRNEALAREELEILDD
jgi:parvulin-like peptidyl-prolyl isomerase